MTVIATWYKLAAMLEKTDHRSLLILALCQALAMTCSALVITTTAIVGRMVAPDPGLATLPLALQFLGLMASTRPAAAAMRRWGRRAGFSAGAMAGVLAGGVATAGVIHQSFVAFCIGAVLTGVFLAHAMHYRFAAADTAPPAVQSRAISLVMAGGVLAAVAGPQLAAWSKDLFAPIAFAGVYTVLSGLCAFQLILLQTASLPGPGSRAAADGPRDERASSGFWNLPRRFLPAALCGMVGYGSMNLVMAVTPPAMSDCGYGFETAAFVIQWHILAMFAPAFATGHIIERLGLQNVLLGGIGLMLGAVAFNATGLTLANFSFGLVLLGIGWNFMFVGATTWLTRIQSTQNTARLQGLNDIMVFGAVAVTALSSGWLFDTLGWLAVNLAIVPGLLVTFAVVVAAPPRPVGAVAAAE